MASFFGPGVQSQYLVRLSLCQFVEFYGIGFHQLEFGSSPEERAPVYFPNQTHGLSGFLLVHPFIPFGGEGGVNVRVVVIGLDFLEAYNVR